MNDSGVITCEAVNARYNLELIQLAPTATYTPPTYTSTFTDVGATGYVVQPTGTPWTYTGLAGVTDSTAWPFFLPGRPPATPWPLSGQTTPTPQVGFIQGESSKFGVSSISQQVTFNTAGSYTLSVQAIGTPTSIGTDPINILVDGKQVETITPITSWATYTSSDFTVTQGVHTVAFMSGNTEFSLRTTCLTNFGIQFLQPASHVTWSNAGTYYTYENIPGQQTHYTPTQNPGPGLGGTVSQGYDILSDGFESGSSTQLQRQFTVDQSGDYLLVCHGVTTDQLGNSTTGKILAGCRGQPP